MSQIDNKVKWCLEKAKKEIANGNRHRGLLKKKEDIEEAKKHIQKANHNLKAAIYLEKGGFPDWAVSAHFYTIYHCFLALIAKYGYESRNQECTIALIESLKIEGMINIDTNFIEHLKNTDSEEQHESNIIRLRENFQYGTSTVIDDKKINEIKTLSKKAIEQTTKEIYESN